MKDVSNSLPCSPWPDPLASCWPTFSSHNCILVQSWQIYITLHQTYNHPILSFLSVLFSSGASLLIVVFQETKPADSVDGKWTEEQEVKVQKRPLTAQNGAAPMAKSDSGEMRNGRSLRENGAKSQSQEVTSSGGDSPDDHEKDERRRATQRVFLKQG